MGIGRNRKLGYIGNFCFCSKSYLNLLVFVSAHFFGVFKFWVTTIVKIRGKQNFRDFRVFDLGYRSKSKTRKSPKLLFFLLIRIGTFRFFAQFIFFHFWILSYNYCHNLKEETYIWDFRVFNFGYRAKSKTQKPRKFSFLFFLKPYHDLLVFEHHSNFNFFIIVTCMFLHL